jgi:hypothetical protein
MTPEEVKKRGQFMQELVFLINRHSIENGSNTPDFLLAEYLLGCLSIYEHTVQKRDQFATLRRNNETSPRTS